MKEIFYYFGIMCFGYVLGTFLCFVYKWMKLGFDLVNEYEEPKNNAWDIYKNNYEGWVVLDGKDTPVKDWLESQSKFNEQMLKADKGMQNACKKSPPPPRQMPRVIKEGEVPKKPTRDTNTYL